MNTKKTKKRIETERKDLEIKNARKKGEEGKRGINKKEEEGLGENILDPNTYFFLIDFQYGAGSAV